MITSAQWQSLLHLRRTDFKYPDMMSWSIVRNLDQFIGQVKSKPVILSDYRPGDPRQHGHGNAIDTTWPGVNPLYVNRLALGSRLFTGIGIYINEAGGVSHHFDMRTDRVVDNPAKWGGIITHPYDEKKKAPTKQIEYVSLQAVIDLVKKKSVVIMSAGLMALIAFGLYLLKRKKSPS